MDRRLSGPLLVLPATLLGLVLAEGAARVLLPDREGLGFHLLPPPSRFASPGAPRPRERVQGGALHTYDARGFRTQPTVDAPVATALFVGDSITEGFGVADDGTLVAAAQRDLEKAGLRVRCLNAGEAGAGGMTEREALEALLPDVRPDLVVLVLFPGNDLTDDWRGGAARVVEGRLERLDPPAPPEEVRRGLRLRGSWLARHSRLARGAMDLIWQECDFLREPDDDMLALQVAVRRATLDEVRRAGARALVVLVPNRLQAGLVSSPDEVWCGNRGNRASYDRLAESAASWGVPVVDLRDAGLGPDDYLPGDEHLSQRGSEVAGARIATAMAGILASAGAPQ